MNHTADLLLFSSVSDAKTDAFACVQVLSSLLQFVRCETCCSANVCQRTREEKLLSATVCKKPQGFFLTRG